MVSRIVFGSLVLIAAPGGVTARAQGDGTTFPFLPYTQTGFGIGFGSDAGDVDRDGSTDVIVAVQDRGVLLYLNRGDAQLRTPQQVYTSNSARDVVLVDLNGDGILDAAVADGAQLKTLIGHGDGTFAATFTLPATGSSMVLSAADLDADGDIDVVSGEFSLVRSLLNQGDGSFVVAQSLSLSGLSTSQAITDWDADGDVDLITGTRSGTLAIWKNNGSGVFALFTSSFGYGQIETMHVDRFNVDSVPDLLVGTSSPGALLEFLPSSNGLLPSPVTLLGPLAIRSIASADLDHDGDVDIIAGGTATGLDGLRVLLNSGTGAFPHVDTYPMGEARALIATRLDPDANADLAFVVDSVRWMSGRGDGSFDWNPSTPFPTPSAAGGTILGGDLDGDGDTDIVMLAAQTIVGPWRFDVGVLRMDGTVQWGQSTPFLNSPVARELADVDGDGFLDLIIVDSMGVLISWRSDGHGVFSVLGTMVLAPDVIAIKAADLDGDGDADLAVLHANFSLPSSVQLLVNDGTGGFVPGPSVTTINRPTAFVLADLDGNGTRDLAVVCVNNPGTLQVWRSVSTASITALTNVTLNATANASALVAGDVDSDGDVDLIVAPGPNSSAAGRIRNLGNGSFVLDGSFGTSGFANASWLQDLDTDGDLDCVLLEGIRANLWENDGHGDFVRRVTLPEVCGSLVIGSPGALSGPELLTVYSSSGAVPSMRVTRYATQPPLPRFVLFCAGDGSGLPCPCANSSPAGSGRGCAHSFGGAGQLTGTGQALTTSDDVVLTASDLPDGKGALFIQGSMQDGDSLGSILGDGLRCVNGSIVRLGMRTTVGGVAAFGAPLGDPAISERGHVPALGGTRYYQVFYRNSASFCTASTFNLTNGIAITWRP